MILTRRPMYLVLFFLATLICTSQSGLAEPKGRLRGGAGMVRNATEIGQEEKEENNTGRRIGRLFSVFQVITFPNDPCSTGAKNGTCYTADECGSRGGVNDGSCAGGFGVCCILTLACGGTSSENCTYFDSNAPTAGGCRVTICPCGDNICQMRLDFVNFDITGPSTLTRAVTTINKGGTISTAGTQQVGLATQCLTDTFTLVNGGGGINPPTICGTNTGEHMYADLCTPNCNDLNFVLGQHGVGATIEMRRWSIKVTQYSCNDRNLAPQGCTQYFYGSTTGQVQSYNFDNNQGRHLANQDQAICIRRERGNCRICYSAAFTDFQVSGNAPTSVALNKDSICGAYSGTMLSKAQKGNDVLNVPGAVNEAGVMVGSNLCGRNKGFRVATDEKTTAPTEAMTICTTHSPFVLNFHTDNWEHAAAAIGEAATGDSGIRVSYLQDAINCNV